MSIDYDSFPLVCDGAGAATVVSTKPMDGLLQRITITIGTLAAGAVDFVITDTVSGAAILTIANMAASTSYCPAASAVTITDGAITDSHVPIPITGTITVVVAGGGAAGAGRLHYWVQR
jgi:hypothetical protein